MPHRLHRSALLALALLLAGCGETDPAEQVNAGYDALGRGDPAEALASFDAALAELPPEHPEHLRASLGAVEATIASDPEAAKERFLALARSEPELLTDRDYSTIGGKLASAGAWLAAVDVLDAGLAAYPGSTSLEALKANIVATAEKSGDSALTQKLQGLGYL